MREGKINQHSRTIILRPPIINESISNFPPQRKPAVARFGNKKNQAERREKERWVHSNVRSIRGQYFVREKRKERLVVNGEDPPAQGEKARSFSRRISVDLQVVSGATLGSASPTAVKLAAKRPRTNKLPVEPVAAG